MTKNNKDNLKGYEEGLRRWFPKKDRKIIEKEIARAQMNLDKKPEYWNGYIIGLRRQLNFLRR